MEKIVNFFKENVLKNKVNMFICLVVFIACIFLLYVLLFRRGTQGLTIGEEDSVEIMNEYEELNAYLGENDKQYPEVDIANNKFVYTDINEIINIFNNNGDAVIFFGYPSCLYCRTAIQILHDTSLGTEIDKILYLNVEERVSRYDELLEKLDDKFKVEEDGKKVVYSPLVLFVVDGRVVSYHKGTLFSQETPYTQLDQSQINGLSEIFRYGINDVVQGLKNN